MANKKRVRTHYVLHSVMGYVVDIQKRDIQKMDIDRRSR